MSAPPVYSIEIMTMGQFTKSSPITLNVGKFDSWMIFGTIIIEMERSNLDTPLLNSAHDHHKQDC